MAHYVMGDIHGEADRFHAMLEKICFSEEDTLILLGDVIDRGPDGIALLLEIMEMPNVIMLLGNHEYMMLQYLSPDATSTVFHRPRQWRPPVARLRSCWPRKGRPHCPCRLHRAPCGA